MHHANHFYGHAHVMARYCGFDETRPPRIAGYLQHGWNVGHGLAIGTETVAGRPLFTWSEKTARRARVAGQAAIPVGAVWKYLLELEPTLGAVPDAERTGTIWYPFHGWERQRVHGDHERLIATIREVETGPVTVCLYWLEHRERDIRELYEAAGFRVICHGYRGYMWNHTDSQFLYAQLAEVRRHRRVASNRLSSAIFYGVSVGCEAAVYGDPMLLSGEDGRYGGQRRITRQWPQLHGTHIDPEAARQLADVELGTAYLASPAEIRDLFGWPVDADRPALLDAPVPTEIPAPVEAPVPAQRLAEEVDTETPVPTPAQRLADEVDTGTPVPTPARDAAPAAAALEPASATPNLAHSSTASNRK
jgi:hypothetical protein